jgi:hypothetical protein
MPLTNNAEDVILDLLFGNTTFTVPSTWYIGLSTTTPVQAQGGSAPFWNFTEPVIPTGGYARIAVANSVVNWGPVATEPTSGYSVQNLGTLAFSTSTGAWSSGSTPLTWGGIFDAATGGTLWGIGMITPAIIVSGSGATPEFTAGQVVINLT